MRELVQGRGWVHAVGLGEAKVQISREPDWFLGGF